MAKHFQPVTLHREGQERVASSPAERVRLRADGFVEKSVERRNLAAERRAAKAAAKPATPRKRAAKKTTPAVETGTTE